MNEFPTMTNLGGFNALIILKGAGGNRGDSMEPLNRRGGGIRQYLTGGQRWTLFVFEEFYANRVWLQNNIANSRARSRLFGGLKWAWQANGFEPTPLQIYKKKAQRHM